MIDMRFRSIRLIGAVLGLAIVHPAATAADSDDREGRRIIRSQPLTGSFQLYGQPRWDLGDPIGILGGRKGSCMWSLQTRVQ